MGFKILEEISVVLGNNKVNNEYFINQVDEKQRASLKHYYEDISGKDIRYIADENQTSATLACEAAQKAIKDNQIDSKAIDLVICISQTPEYTSPTMARFVVEAIGGRRDIQYFDMNQNCTGMLVAMDIANKYFMADESMKYILIVQGDCHSRMHAEQTSPLFGVLSDVGCAIILERDKESGIKNSYFRVIKEGIDSIVYPRDGFSKDNPIIYTKPGLDPEVGVGVELIKEHMSSNELENVKAFCVSQFALASYNAFLECSNIPKEKVLYIGNQYGYTGACSPIIALKEGINKGMIHRGDSVVLWTYGAGIQHAVIEMVY